MLKNIKKISTIVMLVIFVTIAIFQSKADANTVEYKGGADGLIATPNDFFLNLGELLPGDTKEDIAYIKNSTNDEIEVFFKTEPLDKSEYYDDVDYSLLEKLHLKITLKQTSSSEEQLIYDGNLGAELMNDYISLGTYKNGFDGEFIFKIEVPAELQNDYTISATKVKWVFAVEKIENNTQENPISKLIKNVKTGDNIYFLIILLIISVLIIIINFFIKKGRKKHEK